jgi:hypothetical protein
MNHKEMTSIRGEMPKLMHQLDLSTGYHAIHRIDTFSRPLVDQYRKLLPHGGVIPIFEGQFSVCINGSRFTLFHNDKPIHEGGIGVGRDSTWIELTDIIKDLKWTLEAKPRDGLWVAEVPLASIYKLKDDPINWVFDFVRHLAAAMIASQSNEPT